MPQMAYPDAVAGDPVPVSGNLNSVPKSLDSCKVCANAWYLQMSASLTLLRAYLNFKGGQWEDSKGLLGKLFPNWRQNFAGR
ncbi:hypothetical protein SLEP1_g56027 [Rubroshorea leprosula]|uniref:Uncharacterized protein n=1 Tax=Rubroshorea leprosula TaxID=152421 RepID=A0AAV5MH54_9ROSI|nr:hypothetical protein SLEP1_g56027 [Rubroshorea leprosula]